MFEGLQHLYDNFEMKLKVYLFFKPFFKKNRLRYIIRNQDEAIVAESNHPKSESESEGGDKIKGYYILHHSEIKIIK